MLKATLLATKLHHPTLPQRWVQRPRLNRRLDEGLALKRHLTLVSAPAGFGKTSCISTWTHTLENIPVAWLSLDAGDDDPIRFFTYLIAALQKVTPHVAEEIAGVLRAGQCPPAQDIWVALSNKILEMPEHFLLILDDFHLIQDPLILQVLEVLITNPPSPLHLVLITREDPPLPLARLRACNALTEIRAQDLRFTREDAAHFLNDTMSLALSQADLDTLEDKTEGWIAGLQLAALAMTRPSSAPQEPSRSKFIASLSGSHRFILGYLTEQVLDRQPDEVRRFLLRTSILEKLHSDLCDAVTERTDGCAMLTRLYNANLFLIPLDDEGQWYRYHHLFADLLRALLAQLGEEEIASLHLRASRWYAQASIERSDFVLEAVEHALAAKDYAWVSDMLEQHAPDLIMQGHAQSLSRWTQAIPEELRSCSPRADLAFAWMHLLSGAYRQASPYLARVEALLTDALATLPLEESHASLEAEWLVMQALLINMRGKIAESQAAANRALDVVPADDQRVQALAYWALASTFQELNDYGAAVAAYQTAIHHARATDNAVAEMMSVAGLSVLAFEHGQLHLSFETALQAVRRVKRTGVLPPVTAVIYGALARLHYEWLQPERARGQILRALELTTLGGYNSGRVFCRVLLSRLSLLEGDLEAAEDEVQQAADLIHGEAPDNVRHEVAAQQVQVHVARHRPRSAELVLQAHGFSYREQFSYPALLPDRGIGHTSGLLYNSSLKLLLYQCREADEPTRARQGLPLANTLLAQALQRDLVPIALETYLLRAQLHALLGDTTASQADYLSALELGMPEGFVAVFVEQGSSVAAALVSLLQRHQFGTVQTAYVERIIAAFSPHRQPVLAAIAASQPLIEPLTERELDVLRLMAQGATYKQVAAELVISMNTVRSHVKAIYSKLNVHNRTQAVVVAQELSIL